MTQSPYGGTASPSYSPSTEFGATTISGAPGAATTTNDRSPSAPAAAPAAAAPTTAPAQVPTQPPAGAGQPPVGQPPVGQPADASRASSRSARGRGPRRARLQLRHISPLTVLKFSCVLAIALFFVWLILVGVLYGVLDAAGVIENVNNAYGTLNGPGTKPPITAGIVFGGAAIVGVVNIILFVALTTIGSVIYNLCADLVGGVEITLSER